MASHLRWPFIQCLLLLLSCIAAAQVADLREEPSDKRGQYSPSNNPQPQDFLNEQLYSAYLVIQRFKDTITSDPKNITATWTGHDICGKTSYIGFYCARPPGQSKKLTVTAVVFNGFALRAPKLKGFIDQLRDLALFHAASNNFGDEIPHLAGLGYMYELSVRDSLQAQLAKGRGVVGYDGDIGCITTNIRIKFNFDTDTKKGGGKGIIPAGATDAKALLLNYNHLSGPLPANIFISKLSYLALANNNLTGPIPPSIAHMQDSLLEVLLLNNQLSGCLPHELGMLNRAAVIDAGMNQFTGPIPSSFSCLSSVEQLNLAGNRLYGEVPDALCKLAGRAGRLTNLTLSSNYFTSVGPACLSLIKNGVLDVKNNCITGYANQRWPAECAAFLSQPKTCPAVSTTHVSCPAALVKNVVAPEGKVARAYSSYVTYATLHE